MGVISRVKVPNGGWRAPTVAEQQGCPDNLFGYTGLGYDYDSGLTYARARYYKPEIGRFISEDTYRGDLWNPRSQNGYAYVWNNPLRYVDPSGHMGQKYICNSGDVECQDNAEEWRITQIENAGQVFDEIEGALDNLNAFGPAGAELELTLQSLSYGAKYASTVLRLAYLADDVQKIKIINAGEDYWSLGWSQRGIKIDDLLGNNLGRYFPTVDKLENGVVTSIKSYDIVNSYQKAGSWIKQMRSDIRKLANFNEGTGLASDGTYKTIKQDVDFTSKRFQIGILVTELNEAQLEAIRSATDYAHSFGIDINIVMIGN